MIEFTECEDDSATPLKKSIGQVGISKFRNDCVRSNDHAI